jgi:hypothetical protein
MNEAAAKEWLIKNPAAELRGICVRRGKQICKKARFAWIISLFSPASIGLHDKVAIYTKPSSPEQSSEVFWPDE